MMQFDLTSLRIPEAYQEPLNYFLVCLIVFALTNTMMDVAYVRHRWRQTVLASKVLGMTATGLMMIWPSKVAIYGLCLCLFNGFADPRLHIPSIKRNPARPIAKWFFCATLLAHHAGGAFVVSDMLKPVAMDDTRNVADLPIPIIVSCLSEIFSWYTDLKVLMRTAPKWFGCAHQIAVCLQLISCTSLLLWFPNSSLCPTTVVGTMVGSASWLLAGMIGFKNSTHEIAEELDTKASIARLYHKRAPLTQDNSVLPFCQKAETKVVEAIVETKAPDDVFRSAIFEADAANFA